MAVKLEFKGKDIDEAVKAACRRFGVARDALDIQVVSTGSTGIFGLMRRQSVVQASLKGEDGVAVPTVEKAQPDKKKRSRATTKTAPKAAPRPMAADDDEPPAPMVEAAEAVEVAEVREKDRPPRRPKVEPSPVPPEFHEQLKAELAKLLSLMGMESEIVIGEENGKTRLEILGDHVAALHGREGQALDGLQYLLRKMTSDKLPERAMFVVDAGGFRTNRRAELQELAQRLADEVREQGVTRTIPPLNPSERRIVHMLLQDDTTIRSRSVGSGLFKKILIYKPGTQRPRSPGRKRSSRSRAPRS